jgi:hypothetical protein
VLVDPLDQKHGLLAVLQIWRDLFLDVSLVPVVIHSGARGQGEVGALEHGCWSGGGGSVVIPRLRRWYTMALGPMKHGGRRATSTCASLLAAGLFIDSKSLVGNGASLDLAMVEARRLFRRVSRRCWSVAAAASFGECRKT